MRFLSKDTNINFIKLRQVAFSFSVIVLLMLAFTTVTKGLNFGIDFTGGTLVEIKTPEPANIPEMRTALKKLDIGNISIQEFGSEYDVLIRIPQQKGGEDIQTLTMEKVRSALNESVEYRRVEFVGPQVGEELIQSGMKAIIFSLIGILMYIWFRFEWQFGIAAVVALAHDAFMTIGFFAVTQMEFNLSTVAAVLMIAGYSINDTVVVFDRVRENLRKFKKRDLGEVLNLSLNQTLSRTLVTSVTTMLALIALWIFGGEVIQGFVNALILGIVIGTYSSLFVATPLLMYLKIHREEVGAVPAVQGG